MWKLALHEAPCSASLGMKNMQAWTVLLAVCNGRRELAENLGRLLGASGDFEPLRVVDKSNGLTAAFGGQRRPDWSDLLGVVISAAGVGGGAGLAQDSEAFRDCLEWFAMLAAETSQQPAKRRRSFEG